MRFHASPRVHVAVVLLALAALLVGVTACKPATEVPPADEQRVAKEPIITFDPAAYEADRAAMYEKKDLALAEQLLSQYFNDVGLSKKEELARLEKLFGEYEEFQARCHVPDFRIFTGGDRASVREMLEVKARRADEKEFTPIIRTRGWASCIFEDDRWKIYAIQHAASDKVRGYNFKAETGEGWEGWTVGDDTKGIFESLETAAAVDDMPLYSDVIVMAKNEPAAFTVHEHYSPRLFNENGNSWEDFLGQEKERTGIYDQAEHNFRILAFKRFPGTNLGSWKAIYEIRAQEKGATEMKPVLQVMGYASVIFEDGDWRVYATQPSRRIWVQDFDFEAEKGIDEAWPGWQYRWAETVAEEGTAPEPATQG